MIQPSSASWSVYQICSPSEPSAVPWVTQVDIWSQIFDGMEKLNGSMTSARDSASHRPSTATSSRTRAPVTTILRLRAARAREWARSGVLTVSTTG